MVPATVNELSAHDRMILDPEKTAHTSTAREALCRRNDLPLGKYTVVLEGLVDTDAAYSYARTLWNGLGSCGRNGSHSNGDKGGGRRFCSRSPASRRM